MNDHLYAPTETWYQDARDADLWHGDYGLIVNTAALDQRAVYFEVIRVSAGHLVTAPDVSKTSLHPVGA